MNQAVSVLGATGSIGTQTLDVCEKLNIPVCAIAAGRDAAALEAQARKFGVKLAVLNDEAAARDLKTRLADTSVRVASGMEGLCEAAAMEEAETVVTAVVGTVGLLPTMDAIRAKKRIALANKETLVCAGRIVMQAAKEYGAEILPVDSEHSAIFQCIEAGRRQDVKRILLTGSGGPYRGKKREELLDVTKAQTLKHPNWAMGPKITVDSATLMNKGLEYIEAMHLFGAKTEEIRVVIHPQSVVHSLVEYRDGSVIAQLGAPDMRVPIQYALTWPERVEGPAKKLDLTKVGSLTFEEPDTETFGCLRLAMETAEKPGAACAVMNAANEAAVGLYLEEKIGFLQICDLVTKAVDALGHLPADSVEQVLAADREARKFIYAMI